jgi:hypothetical protein
MTTRVKDKDISFGRTLARFRAQMRDPAWRYLVDQGLVTEQHAAELRRMIRSKPAEFRRAMIDLARDYGLLEKLDDYCPFKPRLSTTNVGLLNMAFMIAEALHRQEEGRRWAALEKRPRKEGPTTTKPRRKAGERGITTAH